jgi:hypothetical protein
MHLRLDHMTLSADRYEHGKIVCRVVDGHERKHPQLRVYHAVLSCQREHERWFERADFFTEFPADVLVVKTTRRRPRSPVLVLIVDPLGGKVLRRVWPTRTYCFGLRARSMNMRGTPYVSLISDSGVSCSISSSSPNLLFQRPFDSWRATCKKPPSSFK